jgi:hypothetical protein
MEAISHSTRGVKYCALAAVAMAYGWGYRGTVGHEAGAMVPGALLGLALGLASGRLDWHRRSAVAGLCAAAGWAWGGSISYMEQTFYVLSDSLPDVLCGYSMLFFIGALWAGCGAAILAMAWTLPRSQLESLARVFAAICAVFLLVYVYFLLVPEHRQAYLTLTVRHFHDGDWLSATLTLLVSGALWLLRPRDRKASSLFFLAALAWWAGYGLLTKWGGLRLAPLHRSESWGGMLGVLAVLIVHLWRGENRAALMLARYGIVGGGLAFALAVALFVPLALRSGPLAALPLPIPSWRTAEVAFGGCMGLAIALGARRLIRDGLAPPPEDTGRQSLDTFAVFVILVALPWANFRRHVARALAEPNATWNLLGWPSEAWYLLIAVLVTVSILYGLYLYLHGDRSLVPASAFGKGALVFFMLLWGTAAVQLFDGAPSRSTLLANLCLWLPAAGATCLLVGFAGRAARCTVPADAVVSPADARWGGGSGFALALAAVPLVLAGITALSLAIEDGTLPSRGRLRFGPHAYWRQAARLQGIWHVVGRAPAIDEIDLQSDESFLSQLEFDAHRNVVATLRSGEKVDAHRWFLKNQYYWLEWYGKIDQHTDRGEVPLEFRNDRIYIAWPPQGNSEGYLVLEREL